MRTKSAFFSASERMRAVSYTHLVDVTIDDPELCQRYTARVVRNVKIGPSPEWLARRVVAAGSRPINNVVDVTNYVMFLTGQPLHAFEDVYKRQSHVFQLELPQPQALWYLKQ